MFQNIYKTISKNENEVKSHVEDNKALITVNGKINKDLYALFMKEYCKFKHTTDLIIELTTEGGELTWGYMISQILQRHEGHVQIRVPHYAMSAGTVIALSCNEIILSNCGCLGPIDPYIFGLNVPTSTEVLREFNKESWCKSFFSFGIIQTTFKKLIANYGEKMLSRIDKDHQKRIKRLLKIYGDDVDKIYDYFTIGNHHQTPIYFNDIPSNLNLNIREDVNMLNKIYLRNNKSKENPFSDLMNKNSDMFSNIMKNNTNVFADIMKNTMNNTKKENDISMSLDSEDSEDSDFVPDKSKTELEEIIKNKIANTKFEYKS